LRTGPDSSENFYKFKGYSKSAKIALRQSICREGNRVWQWQISG